VAGKYRKMILM